MQSAEASHLNEVLKNLPSIDEVLRTEVGRRYADAEGSEAAAMTARDVLIQLRGTIAAGAIDPQGRSDLISLAEAELTKRLRVEEVSRLRPVINATGVVIHTNLGRAPLSQDAREAITDAAGSCTLEFDLATGKRGRRGGRVERLIAELAECDEAVVVNNGAAAAYFLLTVLAAPGEVLISRGELVEIGGDFRIPNVLESSGAILREVGTTNRTKLADYSRAMNADTRMILRVHQSNFRIVGFTAAPSREELAAFAKESDVIFYEDLGSGALVDLTHLGLVDEPVVKTALGAGVNIVSFSGDKLLGGPQAGIIAGRKDLVDRIRKHPLFRVLRPDKLAYAALEATLQAYRTGEMFESIPVLKQLSETAESITDRASNLLAAVGRLQHLQIEIIDGRSAVGGGAAPATSISTRLIALSHVRRSADDIENQLRKDPTIPVIARVENDRVLLDLRTVRPEDESPLADAIRDLDN